jgi:signal transduction histidine kinase
VKPISLRRRLAVAFAGLTLLVGITVAGIFLLLMYSVEDEMFNRAVDEEVASATRALAEGQQPQPGYPFVQIHTVDELPEAVREALADHAGRREAAGSDGEHYHFRSVPGEGLFVVARVEDYLVIRPMRWDMINLLGILSLSLTILAAGLGAWLAYRFTRPLKRLTTLVSGADPADLPEDFSAQFSDEETGQLARELERGYRRIRELILRERQFTRDASHELRTPLTVMNNALELFGKTSPSEQQGVLLDRARLSLWTMQKSVEALLMLAREDLSTAPRTTVRLLPLIERAIVNHAELLAEHPVDVQVQVSSDFAVTAHEGALQIIVSNLIGNAFQHCQTGCVMISQQGESLRIRNPAIDLPDDLLVRIKEPDVKGNNSSGMGLGLAIVDRLCQRQGWRFGFRQLADDQVEAEIRFNPEDGT